ncbi:gamma-glutamyl-gamma-aminobutyrate hydrolase family protein [Brevibacterium luteolum]|uniref:Gamma-glutamyl-gamma-aminobutyrate hydrolase family protein n=1 Tax=Brevibacterium luteolum TaxID=199591 RepID=A0A849AQP4_9MICO|nr:gamma-glutamyl-gamma-aminobutyrate hydrolase family protein [Brevibacterium luteolum]MBM7529730.1 gamma-glutamyl-gamma-aminobutyrate hydrolase PuuD [Brevibacterium luteolum]NNG78491.1 gamma-glutamyl-gamma-aminobutyrate hydrolase family protein [Brevibacterium luteolum]
MHRPIIGVTGMVSSTVNGLRYAGTAAAAAVLDAVLRAGGEPRILYPGGDPSSESHWAGLDGLIIPGGSDINPRLYGQEPGDDLTLTDADFQDSYDLEIVREAMRRDIPTLAICRGMQLVNVACGGDLIQHLATGLDHVGTVHQVSIERGSILHTALGSQQVDVSSYHHQAIGRLGTGVVATAYAPDGTIEALQTQAPRLLAVQWHPEDRAHSDPVDQGLFDWLVAQCRADLQRKDGSHRAVTLADVMPAGPQPDPDAPLIAVVVPLSFPGFTAEMFELVQRFTASTLAALNEAGARISIIDPNDPQTRSLDSITRADAVLYLGGGDVDPTVYGGSLGTVQGSYGIDRDADVFSILGITDTLQRGAPLLAVCRGSQLLNVALGGTLIPDLVPGHLHRGEPGEPMFLDEDVRLENGSVIHRILGRCGVTVRSGHHQAVDRLGDGLRAVGFAQDGVVEATELEADQWVLGLQWHPEDPDGNHDDFAAIIREFVSQAAAFQDSGHPAPRVEEHIDV